MSTVSVKDITINLNASEAIDVGHAILRDLEHSIETHYKQFSFDSFMRNKGDSYALCKQLLNTAYGYDYSQTIDEKIHKAFGEPKESDLSDV